MLAARRRRKRRSCPPRRDLLLLEAAADVADDRAHLCSRCFRLRERRRERSGCTYPIHIISHGHEEVDVLREAREVVRHGKLRLSCVDWIVYTYLEVLEPTRHGRLPQLLEEAHEGGGGVVRHGCSTAGNHRFENAAGKQMSACKRRCSPSAPSTSTVQPLLEARRRRKGSAITFRTYSSGRPRRRSRRGRAPP